MRSNKVSGVCAHMKIQTLVAAAMLLTTAGVAQAGTVTASFTVIDVVGSAIGDFPTGGNVPTFSNQLHGTGSPAGTNINVLTTKTKTPFFTIDPSTLCGTKCSGNIQSGDISTTITFTDANTTGGWGTLTGSLTELAFYQADYKGKLTGCTISTISQTDCVNWIDPNTGNPVANTIVSGRHPSITYGEVTEDVLFANGDQIKVTFYNAADWDITPDISFDYIACNTTGGFSCISKQSTTPLPGAVWLFGTVLTGAAGVGGWRRKKGKAAATSAA